MVKKLMFAATLAVIFSAGILSARQLTISPKAFGVCRGTCSATIPCAGTCFCNLDGPAAGFCTQDPIGVKPVAR